MHKYNIYVETCIYPCILTCMCVSITGDKDLGFWHWNPWDDHTTHTHTYRHQEFVASETWKSNTNFVTDTCQSVLTYTHRDNAYKHTCIKRHLWLHFQTTYIHTYTHICIHTHRQTHTHIHVSKDTCGLDVKGRCQVCHRHQRDHRIWRREQPAGVCAECYLCALI